MKQIVTSAPISTTLLKESFSTEGGVEFVIDYAASKFKGKVLITYLSNLELKFRLSLADPEETLALVVEYLKTPTLVSLVDLEDIVINLLLGYQGKQNDLIFDCSQFFLENKDLLDKWIRRINSIPLYALHTTGRFPEFVKSFPEDTDTSLSGINFVHLIKHRHFPALLENNTNADLTYNEVFFNEYCFAGANLFKYFSVIENPIFVTMISMADKDGLQELNSVLEAERADTRSIIESIENVPLI